MWTEWAGVPLSVGGGGCNAQMRGRSKGKGVGRGRNLKERKNNVYNKKEE